MKGSYPKSLLATLLEWTNTHYMQLLLQRITESNKLECCLVYAWSNKLGDIQLFKILFINNIHWKDHSEIPSTRTSWQSLHFQISLYPDLRSLQQQMWYYHNRKLRNRNHSLFTHKTIANNTTFLSPQQTENTSILWEKRPFLRSPPSATALPQVSAAVPFQQAISWKPPGRTGKNPHPRFPRPPSLCFPLRPRVCVPQRAPQRWGNGSQHRRFPRRRLGKRAAHRPPAPTQPPSARAPAAVLGAGVAVPSTSVGDILSCPRFLEGTAARF